MFKKKLVALSAIMIAGLMTFQANVSADAVEEKPYLSLGADLSASQKSKVLELLGVKENEDGTLESIGLSKIEDKEKIHSKMAKFLPETIKFEIADFDFSNESYSKLKGRLFQLILIYSEDINLPYIWEKDSNSAEAGSIFFRRGTKTVKANSYEINEMLDKRLEATYVEQSSLHLEEHLKQLNTLYKNMSSQMYSSSVISNLFKNISAFGTLAGTPQNNPYFPKESYDEFIAKMIEKKKMKIEKVLELK